MSEQWILRVFLCVKWMLLYTWLAVHSEAAEPYNNSRIYIGSLIGPHDELQSSAIALATDYVNSREDILPGKELVIVERVAATESAFSHIQQTCQMLEQNIQALLGPDTTYTVKGTAPLVEALHIPQITAFATDATLSMSEQDYPYLMKLSAPDNYQVEAVVDLVLRYEWTKFAIIASLEDYGRNGAQAFQARAATLNWVIGSVTYFYNTEDPQDIDLTQSLTSIKNKGLRIVILWCLASQAKVILEQARVQGMTTSEWGWVVTDGVTLMEDQLYDKCVPVDHHLRGLIGTRPSNGEGSLYREFEELWHNLNRSRPMETVQCELVAKLTFDAVLLAAYGFHDYLEAGNTLTRPQFSPDICSNGSTAPWEEGRAMMDYWKQVSGPGVNHDLQFTSRRYPEVVAYDIVNLQENGWAKVGDWTDAREHHLELHPEQVIFMGDSLEPPRDMPANLADTTFRVVTIIEEPYAFNTTDEERQANPNILLKGYCVDLLEKLSQELRFNYELHVVKDRNYGGKTTIDGVEEWNGIVGELVRNEADLSVASLTITYERQHVIDFSTPYQDLGLTILMAKESPSNVFWAFLSPFEWGLWAAVAGAFVICGIGTSVCSYISPFGYRGRYTQRRDIDSTKGRAERNALRLHDSLWYSFASWMQQGTDISPLCLSGRLIHGFWWFAVMVITATYTANLAAHLTIARLETGISSAAELARQEQMSYGTVNNSAPWTFFSTTQHDPYRTMGDRMIEWNYLPATTADGIQRVRDSYKKPMTERFAFIFDSAPLEFAANQEPCNLITTEKLFENFGYGLALRKNSPFTEIFNLEILKYRQNGYLEGLSDLWFGGTCNLGDGDSTDTVGEEATVESMAGVFYFLAIGLGTSLIALVCECCVASYGDVKSFRKEKQGPKTLCGALGRRARLVCEDLSNTFCQSLADSDNISSTAVSPYEPDDHQNSYVVPDLTKRHEIKPDGNGYVHEITFGDIIMRSRPVSDYDDLPKSMAVT